MHLHLGGAEKIRMWRLFIAELAQKGIAAGMAPVAIQALENGILIYNINPWVLLPSIADHYVCQSRSDSN